MTTGGSDGRVAERIKRTPWLLLCVCLLLTAFAAGAVGYAEHQADQARFAREATATQDRIDARMESYLALLRGAAGLLSRPAPVNAEEFRIFVDRLSLGEHYPGTLGVGYTEYFGAVGAAEATALARARGWEIERVWPEAPRDQVHAIVLIEPMNARNRAALGYDMHADPTRRAAMDRARDQGDVALSGPVTLVQEIEPEKQRGFLVYAPVYAGGGVPGTVEQRRALLKGFVYMPLRTGDLFEGIFGRERPVLEFVLHDGDRSDEATLLYASGPRIDGPGGAVTERMRIADRVWTARFAPRRAAGLALPLATGAALLGGLLSVIAWRVAAAREAARAGELRAQAAALASRQTLAFAEMFVGVLGHDLRTPLAAISVGAQTLLRRRRDDATTDAVLARMVASSKRMGRMIDQVLDLTRARLGQGLALSPRRTDLGAVARDAVEEVRQGDPTCRVELRVSGDAVGVWDPDRLAQVLSNLLGNAVRYAEGAPVVVEVRGEEPGRVEVRVNNRGVMDPALLPSLFEPFRGSATPRGSAGGLGLGLFITRAIVEAHGGRVDVASSPGAGTTFTVSLPRGAGILGG